MLWHMLTAALHMYSKLMYARYPLETAAEMHAETDLGLENLRTM